MSATPTDDGRRAATVARTTSETDITIELDLDGGNRVETSTGIPFFDHMLAQLGRHGGFDLVVRAEGDLEIDAHHTVEDVGIALGEVFRVARRRQARACAASPPTGCRSTRPSSTSPSTCRAARTSHYEVDFPGQKILGDPPFDPQLVEEFWRAFVTSAAITLHITSVRGVNTHHLIEATFKAVARSLRDAVSVEGGGVPSTKGVL